MPTKLEEFRKKYPAYDDIPDKELADKLYKKFYSSGEDKLEQNDFYRRIGLGVGEPVSETQSEANRQKAMESAFFMSPTVSPEEEELARQQRQQVQQSVSDQSVKPDEEVPVDPMAGAFYTEPPKPVEKTGEEYIAQRADRLIRRQEEAKLIEESRERAKKAREASTSEANKTFEEISARLKDPNIGFFEKLTLSSMLGELSLQMKESDPSAGPILRGVAVEGLAALPEAALLVASLTAPGVSEKIEELDFDVKLRNLKRSAMGDLTAEEDIAKNIITVILGAKKAKDITQEFLKGRLEKVNQQFGRKVADDVAATLAEKMPALSAAAKAKIDTLIIGAKTPALTASQKATIGTAGAIAGFATGTALDVQLNRDEQFLVNLLSDVPALGPIIEKLRVDPNDSVALENLKRLGESTALAGAVTATFKTVGALVGTASSLAGKMKSMATAVDNGGLKPPKPSKDVVVTQSSLVEEPTGVVIEKTPSGGTTALVSRTPQITQRNALTELVAKVNTGLGRAFTSALPKEIKVAFEKLSDTPAAYQIELKRITKDVTKSVRAARLSDEEVNLYLQKGDDIFAPKLVDASDLDRTRLLKAKQSLDEVRTTIQSNQDKINKDLKLKGKKAIGAGLKDGEIYITRTYESTDNPEYLKKLLQALKGQADADASFISKVDNAREYMIREMAATSLKKTDTGRLTKEAIEARKFLKYDPAEQDSIMDAYIYDMVKNLAGDNKTFVQNILKGVQPSGAVDAVKILRKRKDIGEPILDLLGVSKDPIRNINITLANQRRLMAEIEYAKTVEAFATQNAGKVIDISGLIKFFPSVKTSFSPRPFVGAETLEEVSKRTLGRSGSQFSALKDIYTTPQMARYISEGTNLWNWNGGLGSSWAGTTARMMSSYTQATQTALDIPNYFLNVLGAVQSLAANGHVLSSSMINQPKTFKLLMQQLKANDPKAVRHLMKLKQDGVIDTDTSSEIIVRNADLFGSNPTNLVGRAYSNFMRKAGRAYGQPDNYAKILAHDSEMNILRKAFPKMSEDELFAEASKRVTATMPTYSKAFPISREFSKLPIGNYVLYPSEIFRTVPNIVSYGVRDTFQGLNTGNGYLIASGLRRLASLSTLLAGPTLYALNNNRTLGVDKETEEGIDTLSAPWARGATALFTEPFKERKDGTITATWSLSTQTDALAALKIPVMQIIGATLAGKEMKDFQIRQMLETAASSVLSPFTSQKFFTQALINIVSGIDQRTGKPLYETSRGPAAGTATGMGITDKAVIAAMELGETLVPGTILALNDYWKAIESERLRGEGRGVNPAGFPLRVSDIERWLVTGIRRNTMDLEKTVGFDISRDVSAINNTSVLFDDYLRKLPSKKYSEQELKDIVKEYVKIQERKFEGMVDLKDKMDVIGNMKYYDQENVLREFGSEGIDRSLIGSGLVSRKIPLEVIYARGNTFVPDNPADLKDINVLIYDKQIPETILEDLADAYSKLSGRPLERKKREQ